MGAVVIASAGRGGKNFCACLRLSLNIDPAAERFVVLLLAFVAFSAE